MKFSKYAAGFLALSTAATLFLASCGDADKDGKTPMDDNDNKSIVKDMTDGMTDDAAKGVRRSVPENHITKDSPDSANINF